VPLVIPDPGQPGIAHKPTRASRRLIKRMVSAGLTQTSIASITGLSVDSLAKHYRHELDTGLDESIALMERSLYRRGLQGDTTAALFWLKARAGWRDRDAMNVQVAQVLPAGGKPELDSRQVEDAIYTALARMRPSGKAKPEALEHKP
jgi:hypothetical protein